MGFSQGVSGLNAASSNLDTIGNNIANSETTGFKSGSTSFADIYAGSQVGLGVQVTGVTQDFSDGSVNSTGEGLNVAISNNGFFRVVDSGGSVYYTRDGDFQLDANRDLLTSTGMNVTGYPATGTPPTIQQGAAPVDLTIPMTGMSATTTTTSTMQLDLDSNSTAIASTTTFNPADSTTYSFSEPMTAYDSLGNPRNISLYFTKTADNTWDVKAIDGSDPASTVQDLGTMTFNSNGTLNTSTLTNVNMVPVNGSSVGTSTTTPGTTFSINFAGSQQQYTTASSVTGQNVNGYSAGDLTSYVINDDGTITGSYSNGKTQLLGQIVLANFANPQGLTSDGNNVWTATSSSGSATIGTAGSGNFGTMTSGALEGSNVDLSNELVNLIVAQRDYQSNAQTIKAQDTIMQTLVSMD